MKKRIFSFLMVFVLTLSVFATRALHVAASTDSTANLDLTNNTKSVDQKYNLTVTNSYTDVTKVKVAWELDTINVTRKDAKKWNPDTLSWEDDNENDEFEIGADSANGKFTLTNYSSEKVKANVVFSVDDALSDTFKKIEYTDNDSVIGTKVNADKSVNDDADIEEAITTKLYVDKTKFTSDAVTGGTYGTYTVTIMSADVNNVASTTINADEDTILSVGATPSEDISKETTVEFPTGIVGFDAGKIASLNVETTPILKSIGNSAFNISTNEGAVSAIDLKVQVNGTLISDFKDSDNEDVEVTVTTYITKGFTNLSMKYVGTGADPTVVSYDPATGKLVFKTKHFSTFAIGADEVAYLENNNTAYLTLNDAIAATNDDETLYFLKDIALTNADTEVRIEDKNISIDGCGHTLSGTCTPEYAASENNYTYLLHAVGNTKNTTVNVKKLTVKAEGAIRYAVCFDGSDDGSYCASGELDNVTITSCYVGLGVSGNDYGDSDVKLYDCHISHVAPDTAYNTFLNCAVAPQFDGRVSIYGGTYESTQYGAYIYSTGGILNIYGGVFEAETVLMSQCTNSYSNVHQAAEILISGGSFAGNISTNGTNATVEISGGTFTVDPTAYLKTGYEATESGSAWTVTETAAE